ncbi:hypothetical protein M2444_005101 [Paenibacillus sp. PastF-3]|uniref:hypothetical protein n=1 Tax=Paenibacillus sp. PastF-3 TaxID=2940626 RepID=UPI00247398F4|nr:hypothetical protein [Paenibacillus sp. PastF-3]MDH6373271.1 hypothetical protein [Paenibacillus sp. PastF-3]
MGTNIIWSSSKGQERSGVHQSFKIIFVGLIIAALNILFYEDMLISYSIIAVEVFILMYYLLKRKITLFFGYYLIFLCLSLEFSVLVETNQIFGFKDFRIIGVNLGILSLIPIIPLSIARGIRINYIKTKYSNVMRFIKIILFLNVIGVFWGLIGIFINDNNVLSMNEAITGFINVCYNMMALPLLIILVFIYLLSWEEEFIYQIRFFLVSILIGIVFSLILALFFGKSGYYGGTNTLIVSSVIQYLPLMIIIPFYKSEKSTKYILPLAMIGIVLALIYNAQGKLILMCAVIPIVLIMKMIKSKDKMLLFFIPFMLLLVIFVYYIINIELINSVIFQSKLNQSISLLQFWKENWLYNLPNSPKIRVAEFISIMIEYFKKPWFLLMGKGYMGTIVDHTGMIGQQYIPGSFELNQWENGTFYRMHETFNTMFLYHGLVGIIVYIFMSIMLLNNLNKNPWIVIGGFWFLTIYGFSITISAFGIAALLFGLALINNKDNTNTLH